MLTSICPMANSLQNLNDTTDTPRTQAVITVDLGYTQPMLAKVSYVL